MDLYVDNAIVIEDIDGEGLETGTCSTCGVTLVELDGIWYHAAQHPGYAEHLARRMRWETFSFYHGTLTGWRTTRCGVKYEIIPTNGRPAGTSYDMLENDVWTEEPFDSVEQAKAWLS